MSRSLHPDFSAAAAPAAVLRGVSPGSSAARLRSRLLALALILCLAAAAAAAEAERAAASPGSVTDIVITETISPTFEGVSFGDVGPYEHLIGYVEGELDPDHPRNAVLVNLDRAPRNADGLVEYRVDLEILKPVDLSRGNGRIFYEIINRGNKRALGNQINGGPATNDPRLAEHAGGGFLMNEGYTVVWSGWQGDVPPGGGRMVAEFPHATNPDGSPIVDLHREEFIFGNLTSPVTANLSYPAATLDTSEATLTVRQHERDPRQPLGTWEYVSDTQIRVTRPAGFDAGAIYEFIYPAKDPTVMGMGFAATSNIVSKLRYEDSADNPLAGAIDKTLVIGRSQSGRFLRDLLYLGFNADEAGRAVFDGVIPIIAGSRRTNVNMQFSIPGNYSRQHENHLFPDDQFPFTYEVMSDPVSGRTDGIFVRCQVDGTCPNVFHVDTDTEVFQARSSLVVTDTSGAHIDLPDNVRAYFMEGSQHIAAGAPTVPAQGQYPANPLDYIAQLRALVKALDEWVTDGTAPPDSRFPSVADGTFVAPDAPAAQFPAIPGHSYTGLVNELRLLDYSVQPPAEGASYPVFVGAKDADGNNVAGVRHPFLQVPTATHTGWNLRRQGFAEGALLGLTGSYLPFAETAAERLASGDERLSLEERYPNHGAYVSAVARAANAQVRDRLLLAEDAERIVEAAAESDIGKP